MNSEAFNDSIEIEYKKPEIKLPAEDIIVSGENFVLPKLEKLDIEIEAKRSGPKSAAQTPSSTS